MEILIESNHMRLLAVQFLHLHTTGVNRNIVVGEKYKCVSAQYGDMGVVECTHLYSQNAYDISKATQMLSLGHDQFMQRLRDKGGNTAALMQCCVFKWVRRYDAPLQQMVATELAKMKHPLVRQPELSF